MDIPDSEYGRRVERRLRDELIAWLVTVSPAGTPQPSPIWFLWDGETALIYSQPATAKLRNAAANPRAALHLDGNGEGGDIMVLEGTLAGSDDPPADTVPDYVAKYGPKIAGYGWTPESFAADYSVPLRFVPRRLRGH